MEQLEQQKEILELGKLLVKELGLEDSVDTLSRWMAHYVAEKIKHIESLGDKNKKNNAEKECFYLILDLWKNRWQYESGRQPLRDFNHLFNILENIDPEKEEPYYYRFSNSNPNEGESECNDLSNVKNLAPLARQIDKVARIWIDYLLREAATISKNKDIKKIVNHAVKLPDPADVRIINFVISTSPLDEDKQPVDRKELDKKLKIETLTHRIEDLQKFKKINEYLITQYKKQLNGLKKK